MASGSPEPVLRIRVSDERRRTLIAAVQRFCADLFDEPLSDFRAQELLDFFIRELGPPVYNQGVHDAAAYLQERLADLEGEVYEPEPRRRG